MKCSQKLFWASSFQVDRAQESDFAHFLEDQLKIGKKSETKPPLKPMWAACPFCSVEFDVIGHMENFEKDAAFIFITMGLMVRN